jgi:hypothetical protein
MAGVCALDELVFSDQHRLGEMGVSSERRHKSKIVVRRIDFDAQLKDVGAFEILRVTGNQIAE